MWKVDSNLEQAIEEANYGQVIASIGTMTIQIFLIRAWTEQSFYKSNIHNLSTSGKDCHELVEGMDCMQKLRGQIPWQNVFKACMAFG